MDLLLLIALISTAVMSGHCYNVKMETQDSEMIVGSGNVTLQCVYTVTGENGEPTPQAHDFVPKWRKLQDFSFIIDHSDGTIDLNSWIMAESSRVVAPINSETRVRDWTNEVPASKFKPLMSVDTSSGLRITYTMQISGLNTRDTGIYLCEVRDDSIKFVAHTLHVSEEVESMQTYGNSDADTMTADRGVGQGAEPVIFHEGVEGYFECNTTGGYPKPQLSVYVGDRGLGNNGARFSSMVLFTGDIICNQEVKSIASISYDNVILNKKDNGMDMTCKARVTRDSESQKHYEKIKITTIVMFYKPSVDCVTRQSVETSGYIQCMVTSRPQLDSVTWEMVQNGKVVAQVQSKEGSDTNDDYKIRAVTETASGEDMNVVKLWFDQIDDRHIDQSVMYRVTATNAVGSANSNVTVTNEAVEPSVGDNHGQRIELSCLFLLLCSYLSWIIC